MLFLFFFVFVSPKFVIAQIFINEVSPVSSPEWVELYNDSNDNVDISGWKLVDLANNTKTISSAVINSHGYYVYESVSSWLNNTGQESLALKNSANETIDSLIYGTDGIVGIPSADKSIGRSPDGSTTWVNNLDWTKGSSNYLITPTPSPTETPTTTETPTPTPTPSKSIYTINKSKDETGQELSSVEIYVDSIYTHHLDNEILEFCNGCFCDPDKAISCGYGQHTIKLTKSGYSDWSEIRNFTQGTNYEITPILTKISFPTPTPTPVKTPTPTATKTPTATPSLRGTPWQSSSSSPVLGSSTDSAIILPTDTVIARSGSDAAIQESPPTNTTVFKYTFIFGAILTAISGGWLYFRHHSD